MQSVSQQVNQSLSQLVNPSVRLSENESVSHPNIDNSQSLDLFSNLLKLINQPIINLFPE